MFLLDTNVVSELRKIGDRRADTNVTRWAESVTAIDMHISAITLMEVEIGIQRLERLKSGGGARLRMWMNGNLLGKFAGRILPIDSLVALRCASLHVPRNAPYKDSLIAATGLVHDLTVVTRNTADFAPTGVRLLNPWNAE